MSTLSSRDKATCRGWVLGTVLDQCKKSRNLHVQASGGACAGRKNIGEWPEGNVFLIMAAFGRSLMSSANYAVNSHRRPSRSNDGARALDVNSPASILSKNSGVSLAGCRKKGV